MDYAFRKAEIRDLGDIMKIYGQAQKFMSEHGNPQWPKGFPDENDIKGGIYGGILYLVIDGGNTAAVFSAVNHEGNYDEIEGDWLTRGNYLALHRVAVAEEYRGKGAAKFILLHAGEELARARGRTSLRLDTHEKNYPMQGLLKSCGFSPCGVVHIYRDDTARLAFEKILT